MVRRVRVTVRLDPIAELRRLAGSVDPDPVDAAVLADMAGVDGLAVRFHLDSEVITRRDLDLLGALVKSHFTVEVTGHPRAVDEVIDLRPDRVVLISDSSLEMTGDREFGIDVVAQSRRYAPIFSRCHAVGVSPWILIEPREEQVSAARDIGAEGVVLDTTRYAGQPMAAPSPQEMADAQREERSQVEAAARCALDLGMNTAVAGGLGRRVLADVVTIPEVEEVIMGYLIAARAVFVGLEAAIGEIIDELPRVGEEV